MANLYALTSVLRNAYDRLLDGTDEDMFFDIIDISEENYTSKLEDYAKLIKSLNADIDTIKAEENRLEDRRRAIEKNVERLKFNIEQSMRALGKSKVKTPLFSLNIQSNPLKVLVVTEGDIPKKYWHEKPPTLAKAEILRDLKFGEDIPGVTLHQTESLRIR